MAKDRPEIGEKPARQHNSRPMGDATQEVLKHVARLWGFDAHLESVDPQGRVDKRWTAAGPRH